MDTLDNISNGVSLWFGSLFEADPRMLRTLFRFWSASALVQASALVVVGSFVFSTGRRRMLKVVLRGFAHAYWLHLALFALCSIALLQYYFGVIMTHEPAGFVSGRFMLPSLWSPPAFYTVSYGVLLGVVSAICDVSGPHNAPNQAVEATSTQRTGVDHENP